MGSRDDQTKPRQPLLSSLVVRPSDSGGGDSGAADYEPGEVRSDAPPNSRSDRYSDDHHGHRKRALSGSPAHRRDVTCRLSADFDHPGDLHHGQGFGGGRVVMRSPGRYRHYSPPFARDHGSGRLLGKPLDGPGMILGRFKGEGSNRNNPNVRPREGDWYCPDPRCRNLNFARREYCNKCNLRHDAQMRSPRRGYGGPPAPMISLRHYAPTRSPRRGYGGPMVSPRRDAPMRSPRRGYGGPMVSPRRDAPMRSPRRGYGGPMVSLRSDAPMRSPRRGYGGPMVSPRHDALTRSPTRGYGGPPPPILPPRRYPGSPMDRFPGRFYLSPPRGLSPRDLGPGGPPRRLVSPPPLGAHRGWRTNRDVRPRSQSPRRVGGALPSDPPRKNFRRFLGAGRDRLGNFF